MDILGKPSITCPLDSFVCPLIPFGDHPLNLESYRRLAWPLRKDGTHTLRSVKKWLPHVDDMIVRVILIYAYTYMLLFNKL